MQRVRKMTTSREMQSSKLTLFPKPLFFRTLTMSFQIILLSVIEATAVPLETDGVKAVNFFFFSSSDVNQRRLEEDLPTGSPTITAEPTISSFPTGPSQEPTKENSDETLAPSDPISDCSSPTCEFIGGMCVCFETSDPTAFPTQITPDRDLPTINNEGEFTSLPSPLPSIEDTMYETKPPTKGIADTLDPTAYPTDNYEGEFTDLPTVVDELITEATFLPSNEELIPETELPISRPSQHPEPTKEPSHFFELEYDDYRFLTLSPTNQPTKKTANNPIDEPTIEPTPKLISFHPSLNPSKGIKQTQGPTFFFEFKFDDDNDDDDDRFLTFLPSAKPTNALTTHSTTFQPSSKPTESPVSFYPSISHFEEMIIGSNVNNSKLVRPHGRRLEHHRPINAHPSRR